MKHETWLVNLRPKNLLMVALTQAVCWSYLRWRLPVVDFRVLNSGNLALLVFSTVCITAAGYLINDFYDTAIDARNKPEKALPDTPEIRRKTLLFYGLLNAVGVLAAVPPALAAGKVSLLMIQAGTVGLLWAYSAFWKRMPVIGNVVVAALTALSILLVVLYEPLFWNPGNSPQIFRAHDAILGLSGFAFLLTWMREMVKDIEDLEGDRAEGCRTLPIVWGVRKTVLFVALLSVFSLLFLGVISGNMALNNGFPAALLILFLIFLPLVVWTITLSRQKTPAGFHRHSNLLKLLMLGGLVCLWLV